MFSHPAVRTFISLLIAASVTGAIAAIDFLRERLPGQTGLLDSPQAWMVLLPILTALLDAARRWLTDWQKREPLTPEQLADRVDVMVAANTHRLNAEVDRLKALAAERDAALQSAKDDYFQLRNSGIAAAVESGQDLSQYTLSFDPEVAADLDVERSWRDVRREAKRKRRELRNQPDGVRQSALAVLIWPFLNAVIAWAVANIGPKIIEWLQKQLEKLRRRFPQAQEWHAVGQWVMDQPLDSPFWENVQPGSAWFPDDEQPRISTGPAPKLDDLGITHIHVRIPPAPIPAPAPEGGDPSLGSTGDPDSMTRLGAWKNPPRTGE